MNSCVLTEGCIVQILHIYTIHLNKDSLSLANKNAYTLACWTFPRGLVCFFVPPVVVARLFVNSPPPSRGQWTVLVLVLVPITTPRGVFGVIFFTAFVTTIAAGTSVMWSAGSGYDALASCCRVQRGVAGCGVTTSCVVSTK